MAVKAIPEGYHTITPYMMVQGATNLLVFLKQVFHAKEISKSDMPDGTIMHAELKIGDSTVMLSEARGEYLPMPSSFYIYVEDTDAVYNQALEAGGISIMKPADQFYGDRNAGIKDPSGNIWWISTHVEDLSMEEMKKREEEYLKKMGLIIKPIRFPKP